MKYRNNKYNSPERVRVDAYTTARLFNEWKKKIEEKEKENQ